jgi:hypothetical protein
MATHETPTSDSNDDVHGSTKQRATSRFGKWSRDGSLATVAGGATLLWAARTIRKSAGRGTLLALAGAALIGVGRRQRRGDRGEHAGESGITLSLDEDGEAEADEQDEERFSDDAHVQGSGDLGAGRNADESESGAQSTGEAEDVNPRGVADDEALEQDDGGEFDFVAGEDSATHQEPHLDEEVDQDPRVDDGDDAGKPTEIDLSEASMADESSEAAGPQPEQAFPTMEGTDPEPQSAEAPPRSNEGMESAEESDAENGEDAGVDDEFTDAGDETTEAGEQSTADSGEATEANDETGKSS